MATPLQYYRDLPPVAKTYGVVCLMTSAAYHWGLYDLRVIALFYGKVLKNFQIWRLITNFFFLGPFSFTFAFRLLLIARHGVQLERGPFDKRTADYPWMFIFGALSLLVMAIVPLLWSPFMGASIVFMIVYVWSREFPNERLNIHGLFQLKIVQLILNSTEVQVNLQNMKGFTALDLLNQNFSDSIDNDISQLLLQAGAKEGYALQSFEIQTHHHPQPPPPPIPKSPKFKKMMVLSLSSMTKSVLLAVFIFLAGATYLCLFSLTNIYSRENRGVELAAISFKDLISASHRLPKIFYFLVFNTVTFAGSMIVILLNTWSLVNEWSLCFRAIPMFVMGALLVSYALIVKEMTPKFY